MKRALGFAGIALALIALGAIAALWGVYRATQHVRPFYAEALDEDPVLREQASRQLATQAGALYSDAQRAGTWSAVFTAEQLNGWLAVELATKFAEMLPTDIHDPRIAITPDALSLGFRSEQAGIETVVTVDTEVFLTESGEVAIRLAAVRAGALPLPVGQVAEEIQSASKGWALPLRWSQVDGDVVALLDIASAVAPEGELVEIHTFELHDGEIYIAGETVAPAVAELAAPDAPKSDAR